MGQELDQNQIRTININDSLEPDQNYNGTLKTKTQTKINTACSFGAGTKI